ncbi:MAG TPA: hypothetical protein VI413_04515 [Paludibacter sp.]
MRNTFIKVRYDRMQNAELKTLYQDIMCYLLECDADMPDLSMAFTRFCNQKEMLQNLNAKQRKLPQTEQIVELRKETDNLVSAMLLNMKALKRAAFDDQVEEIKISYDWTNNLLKNFVHEGRFTKNSKLKILLNEINKKEEIYAAFEKLGLLRYSQKMAEIRQQIADCTEKNNVEIRQRPATGITIPSKEHIIGELRLLLQTIEITAITHPETDYKPLINYINLLLTEARTQLRNLATRRKTAKAKAEQKQQADEAE